MEAVRVNQGIKILPSANAIPFYLMSDQPSLNIKLEHNWYLGFHLGIEKYRGLNHLDNHLHIATFSHSLTVNQSLTIIATTEAEPNLNSNEALSQFNQSQESLLSCWQESRGFKSSPQWIEQLVLAANQFIVNRSFADQKEGKTLIAGYPWFSDWGRDTAISLTGLTLVTGRYQIARQILLTFSHYLNQGMLPNYFPDGGEAPIYNTVDAVFWYFESVNQYYQFTYDLALIEQLFPLLDEVINWHCQGTRYHIHLDKDGLIYAGEKEVQLTWMDAKVDDWVVTPRQGKPIEINALWYNALQIMIKLGHLLGQPTEKYETLAQQTKRGFPAFWNDSLGYCYDVIDSPNGHDAALRPNQIFAVSLNQLLSPQQEKLIVDTVSQHLITSYGLRSLSPNNNNYQGQYGGDRYQRDSAYHQGTTWGWLLGHFVQAHLKVYHNPQEALSFLTPMQNHLTETGMGSMSEIFDGDPPFTPRGCLAQAWSVAEILRAFSLCQTED
jgi:predicted glycogen debranching enzyme